MTKHRNCKTCNSEYEYEGCANLILFCPHCHKYDFLECEYGYGPVVPCRIYCGSEIIGMITYEKQEKMLYRLDSEKYNLHKVLECRYLEALEEARNLMAGFL